MDHLRSETVGARIDSTWLYCVRHVLLYCYETWELAVVDEVRLRGEEPRMIRTMCGVRLVERLSTNVLRDRVGVVCEN